MDVIAAFMVLGLIPCGLAALILERHLDQRGEVATVPVWRREDWADALEEQGA